MMARSTCSNQRPNTLMQDRICQVDETSCNARPDHTLGQTRKSSPVRAMSGLPLEAAEKRTCQYRRSRPLADIKRALTPPENLRERADLCTTFAGGAARGTLEAAGQNATRWSRTRRTDIDRLCPEHTVGLSRHRPRARIIDSGHAIVMVVDAHRAAGNLSHGTC